jgi:hypothetical protein
LVSARHGLHLGAPAALAHSKHCGLARTSLPPWVPLVGVLVLLAAALCGDYTAEPARE